MAWLDDYLQRLRNQYPAYVLLIKQGRWYSVYDQDADVMHRILNWDIADWGNHKKSGGPVLDNIINALKKNGFAYKVINGTTVVQSYDPPDPHPELTAAKNLPASVVRIGSKVTVCIDGDEDVYTIGEEGNYAVNRLSYDTPIAKAILGCSPGETVIAKAPIGNVMVTIVKLEN